MCIIWDDAILLKGAGPGVPALLGKFNEEALPLGNFFVVAIGGLRETIFAGTGHGQLFRPRMVARYDAAQTGQRCGVAAIYGRNRNSGESSPGA